MTPSFCSTRPWLPGVRNLSPCRSASERISRRNQPNICVPVLPAWKPRRPNGAYSSSHSFWPLPCLIHAAISPIVKPNGNAVKNAQPSDLPVW